MRNRPRLEAVLDLLSGHPGGSISMSHHRTSHLHSNTTVPPVHTTVSEETMSHPTNARREAHGVVRKLLMAPKWIAIIVAVVVCAMAANMFLGDLAAGAATVHQTTTATSSSSTGEHGNQTTARAADKSSGTKSVTAAPDQAVLPSSSTPLADATYVSARGMTNQAVLSNTPTDTVANSPPSSGSSVTSYSSATTTDSTVTVAVASSDVKGKVNLRFQVSTGYKTSAKCVTVKSWAQRAGHKCFIVGKKMKGKHYANSGVDRNGYRKYFTDYVGSKYTPVGSKFYYDSRHHTWRKSNCGNYVRFSSLPKLTVSSIALVRSFGLVKVKVKTSAKSSVTAYAKAWAKTDTCYAEATAQATGTGSAYAYAYAYAMTAAQASAKAAASIRSQVRLNAVANAKVAAASSATASASARATCSSTPPPPPSYSPPIVSVTAEACVAPGGTSGVVDVVVTNPNNIADTAVVVLNGQTKTVAIAANSSVMLQFTGFGPGTYSGTATLTTANKSVGFAVTVAQCETPPPANKPPTGMVNNPQHLNVNGTFIATATGSDPEDGGNVTVVVDVTGAATRGALDCSVSNGQKTCTFEIQAGPTAGTAHIHLKVLDSDGASFEMSVDFPVLADDFGNATTSQTRYAIAA